MFRIVLISDTHSLHKNMLYDVISYVDSTKTNILIHAGDCTSVGKQHETTEFIYWLQNLKGFDEKIFIAGNHDFSFERMLEPHHSKDYDWLRHLLSPENLSQSDVTYLIDEEIIIERPEFSRPIKIYGSPWQPEFYNWAFNLPRNGEELEKKWNAIPDDTDILITHGPPFGYLDITPSNQRVGCDILNLRIQQIKPIIHVFGHIHHSYGIIERNGVNFVNACICDERYRPMRKPIVVDLFEDNGEFYLDYDI